MNRQAPLLLVVIFIIVISAPHCQSIVAPTKIFVIRQAIARNVDIKADGSSCQGVIVQTDKVLTAAHCSGENMKVGESPATPEKIDMENDLLLLATKTDKFPLLVVSDEIYVTQTVMSAANFNLPEVGKFIGITDFQQVNFVKKDELFVTRLQMLRGYSGSAVWDERGRLVGIEQQIWGGFLESEVLGQTGAHVFAKHVQYTVAIHGTKIKKFLASE